METGSSLPKYLGWSVLHCKIDAMPASVPITAARATSFNVWHYLVGLAQAVCEGVSDLPSRNGCIVAGGAIVHPEVLRHVTMQQDGLAYAV
jgi:alanine dehydrogenase